MVSQNFKLLKTRIRICIEEMNPNGVQRACTVIKTKLRSIADQCKSLTVYTLLYSVFESNYFQAKFNY